MKQKAKPSRPDWYSQRPILESGQNHRYIFVGKIQGKKQHTDEQYLGQEKGHNEVED